MRASLVLAATLCVSLVPAKASAVAGNPATGARLTLYAPAKVKAVFEYELGYKLEPVEVGRDVEAIATACRTLPYSIVVLTYRSVSAASAAFRFQAAGWHYSGQAARQFANVIVTASRRNAEVGTPGREIPMPAPAVRALHMLASQGKVGRLDLKGRTCPATT